MSVVTDPSSSKPISLGSVFPSKTFKKICNTKIVGLFYNQFHYRLIKVAMNNNMIAFEDTNYGNINSGVGGTGKAKLI